MTDLLFKAFAECVDVVNPSSIDTGSIMLSIRWNDGMLVPSCHHLLTLKKMSFVFCIAYSHQHTALSVGHCQ